MACLNTKFHEIQWHATEWIRDVFSCEWNRKVNLSLERNISSSSEIFQSKLVAGKTIQFASMQMYFETDLQNFMTWPNNPGEQGTINDVRCEVWDL